MQVHKISFLLTEDYYPMGGTDVIHTTLEKVFPSVEIIVDKTISLKEDMTLDSAIALLNS